MVVEQPPFDGRSDYLRRLSPGHYRGNAVVHWSMTTEARKVGWLRPAFHFRLREVLTHTMFRYGICCPIYCCMPDHIHLLWMGLFEGSDQRNAAKHFRRHVNELLEQQETRLQKQGFENVLSKEQCEGRALESVVEYIASNPERAGLVAAGRFREYEYTGCLFPGHPDLNFRHNDYWERFERACSYARRNGLIQLRSSDTE